MSTIKVYLSFFNLCKIIEMIVYERKESNLILQQNKLPSTSEFKGHPNHPLFPLLYVEKENLFPIPF